MSLDFAPDGRRAVEIDALMQARLANGLETIAGEASAIEPPVALGLDAVIAALRSARATSPALWGHYADLCRGIALDDLDAVFAAAARLRDGFGAPAGRRLCNLTDDDLGESGAALYARMIDDDADLPLALRAVDAPAYARMAAMLPEALALIAAASDDVSREIDIFGRQLVIATGLPGKTTFSGAATLFLWGAVLLNPEFISTRLKLAEALIHECSHALLTGLTGGEDVTTNDRDERFPSPLRADPRPMEGLAHATFVLARMIDALDRIGRTVPLTEPERAELAAMQADNKRFFRDGAKVVRDAARFTPKGKMIFADCFAAMQRHV